MITNSKINVCAKVKYIYTSATVTYQQLLYLDTKGPDSELEAHLLIWYE